MIAECLEPWRPRPGDWDRAAALHLLRRAAFGGTRSEVERALSEGPDKTLARLCEDHTEQPLRSAARSLLPAEDLGLLQAWWFALILDGGAPLRERVTLAWHDHFATSYDKVADVHLMHAQNELFRSRGLGDFRALLHSVARDPAMLLWLDGDSNRRGNPNENFAREVMELFALGIGNYREADVRAAARAFSGWGTSGREFVFRPEHHDGGEKTLFGRTGDWNGAEAVDLLLEHPACSRHVARFLLEAFVAPRPRDEWVEAVARVLLDSAWDVETTLRILLRSRLFYARENRRARIAGPVELIAVTTRSLDARVQPDHAARAAAGMGQALFRPPSVKGWDGGRTWIHSGSWIARHNLLVELASAAGRETPFEVELEHAFPTDKVDELGALVLAQLLPEATGGSLEESVRQAVRASEDLPAARRVAVASVLTSPEYHLF